ncbi:serine/arginine repetitive matrix protein 1-like [Drosophila obscura]|uniref:serine/arginine repetitive matrix protein 1-like n=1 Tax=Drosophila obscura TaxID=7282 RepID=UPI001BB2C2F9|nr:serine/arginine repetitive matrix protein 1-like [Drosophila obscura]
MARQIFTYQGFFLSKTAMSNTGADDAQPLGEDGSQPQDTAPNASIHRATTPGSPRANSGVAVTGLPPVQAAPPHAFTGEHSTQNADLGGIPSHVAVHPLQELAEGPSTSRVALRRLAIAGDATVAAIQGGRPHENIGELQLLRRENAALRSELKRLRQREQERRPPTGALKGEPRHHQRWKSPPPPLAVQKRLGSWPPPPGTARRTVRKKRDPAPHSSTDSEAEVLRDGCFGKARLSMATRHPATESSHQPRLREACPSAGSGHGHGLGRWAVREETELSEKTEPSEEEGPGESETLADSGKGRGDDESTEEYPRTESGIDDGRDTPPSDPRGDTPLPEPRPATPPPELRADTPPSQPRAATPPPELRADTPPPDPRVTSSSNAQEEEDDLSIGTGTRTSTSEPAHLNQHRNQHIGTIIGTSTSVPAHQNQRRNHHRERSASTSYPALEPKRGEASHFDGVYVPLGVPYVLSTRRPAALRLRPTQAAPRTAYMPPRPRLYGLQ